MTQMTRLATRNVDPIIATTTENLNENNSVIPTDVTLPVTTVLTQHDHLCVCATEDSPQRKK